MKLSVSIFVCAVALFFCSASASAQTLAWDEDPASTPIISGYAVTIDGVRTDYGLSPTGPNNSCGCAIALPFSGGVHTIVVSAYSSTAETASRPLVVGPSANSGGPYSGTAGAAIAVDGSGSLAPTGYLASYAWDWGDGTRQTYSTATASHVYNAAGVFTVKLTVTDNAGATASAATSVTVATGSTTPSQPGTSSSPYTGTPASLPGTIQAENFDNGGAGVAYVDATAGNTGGQYRATDVDIEATSDAGGGYNVGWTAAGEWLNYTVNVSAPGTYTLQARVASWGRGGTFHVEVNGIDRTGPIAVPDTGGWQAWQTLTVNGFTLPSAGVQLVRVVLDATGPSGNVGNLNYLRVVASAGSASSPYGGSPAPVPGRIEAENFDQGGQGVAYADTTAGNSGGQYRSTDVDIEGSTDAGGGYDVGWMDAGEWLNYTITVTTPGVYTLQARVASAGQGGTFHVEVNGVDRTGPLAIPDTGGWQAWQTLVVNNVAFPTAGVQVLRVVLDTNGPNGPVGNLNYLIVGASTPYGGTPASVPGRLEAENFDEGGQGVAYLDTSAGNSGGQYRATDVDIEATSDTGGGYNVGWMSAGEWLNYTVNVTAAGTYSIRLRVASNGVGGTLHVEVNGADRTGAVSIPDTGAWQNWTTLTVGGVSLNAGVQVVRVVLDTAGPNGAVGNLNYISIAP